jgi:hypothetical protein
MGGTVTKTLAIMQGRHRCFKPQPDSADLVLRLSFRDEGPAEVKKSNEP